jgi:hypothetical protein
MRLTRKLVYLVSMLTFASTLFAADPFVGTWKLALSKPQGNNCHSIDAKKPRWIKLGQRKQEGMSHTILVRAARTIGENES